MCLYWMDHALKFICMFLIPFTKIYFYVWTASIHLYFCIITACVCRMIKIVGGRVICCIRTGKTFYYTFFIVSIILGKIEKLKNFFSKWMYNHAYILMSHFSTSCLYLYLGIDGTGNMLSLIASCIHLLNPQVR